MYPTLSISTNQAHRRRVAISWRAARNISPQLPTISEDYEYTRPAHQSSRQRLLHLPKFRLALGITLTIIIVQLFIVNHYIDSEFLKRRHETQLTRENLLSRHQWLCYSLPHLNKIQDLATEHHVQLVIVDPDLLDAMELTSDPAVELKFATGAKFKSHQGPSEHKSIIHLAAINETSGGQPNLKSFHEALKKSNYIVLKYNDASQLMPDEIYRSNWHQFDDVQADALRDLNHLEQSPDFEISKIYTEFITHMFILNSSNPQLRSSRCPSANLMSSSHSFIVIHIFVLYNYEYEPEKSWIQSSLRLDEIERHKLLTYGVHSVDLRIPFDDYYTQKKRPTRRLLDVSPLFSSSSESLKFYRVFEPIENRRLEYANNTYLHCKMSPFNMSGLMEGDRKMSNFLELLDSARPLGRSPFSENINQQLRIAFQFMGVFSRSYGKFSYWLTGSSLLAYHKYCELVIMLPNELMHKHASPADNQSSEDPLAHSVINLDFGLFAAELNDIILQDLSRAKMVGITMIADWRKPDSHISFHVKDCPNLIFNLYRYELKSNFHQNYFIVRNSLTFNRKFRRKLLDAKTDDQQSSSIFGQHIFTTSNMKLCWTRIDQFHPFRVPCDVHEHLRRIYVA